MTTTKPLLRAKAAPLFLVHGDTLLVRQERGYRAHVRELFGQHFSLDWGKLVDWLGDLDVDFNKQYAEIGNDVGRLDLAHARYIDAVTCTVAMLAAVADMERPDAAQIIGFLKALQIVNATVKALCDECSYIVGLAFDPKLDASGLIEEVV